MATIVIKELTAEACIGVYDWERQIKQKIKLDVDMDYDISPAAKSDNVADALDYSRVVAQLTEIITNSEYQLLESLISALGSCLEEKFHIKKYRIYLRKPAVVKNTKEIGIVLEKDNV